MKWKMENRRWKIQSGFTLIEILVGLTIIGLLFGVGYVNFRDFSRRQAIAGAAKLLQGDLRLAQQQASSGQKPDDINCNDPNTLTGYFFNVVSSSEYTIFAGCSAGYSLILSKDVTLPPGISIASTQNPILFKVLGAGTNIPQGSTITITLTQEATNNISTISVGSGGEIQ